MNTIHTIAGLITAFLFAAVMGLCLLLLLPFKYLDPARNYDE